MSMTESNSGPGLFEGRNRAAAVGIPLLVVGIVVVMVVPMPTALLDLLLAANISLAVLILLTAMVVRRPLNFSVFPALLLVTTLFRLSLNVSTTRRILDDGYAGKVIQAFGNFVVSGNLVIGLVIFLILVVIQFAVITAGAQRVAEVAARFTLDAMPGKQMTIDADLSSGLISEDEAKRKRSEVAQEADFYGAMDGASKFIKGDAIASVVVVAINLLGGFAVGVFQQGLSVGDSVQRFALLSIGDGLVSQIPALLISVGAGLVVTRVTTDDDQGGLGGDLASQLFQNQRALAIGGVAVAMLGILPGLPKVPFFVLAAILAGAALRARTAAGLHALDETALASEETVSPDSPEQLINQVRVEPLELELAADLFDLVDTARGGNLLDRVRALRRQIAFDLGLVVPLVRTRDNLQLPPSTYVIRVHGVEAGRGEAPPHQVLVLAEGDASMLPGRPTTEPVFGLPAAWVPAELAETLEAQGHTVVDRASVLVTHLSEVVRRHAGQLLSRQDVQSLVDAVRDASPAMGADLTGDTVTLAEIQSILRGLLAENVPIRDLVRIMEAVTAKVRETRDPEALLEASRRALGPAISAQASTDGLLQAITLEPMLEHRLLEAVAAGDTGTFLAIEPQTTEMLLDSISRTVAEAENQGHRPALVCSQQIRPSLHRLVAASRPDLPVLSYTELNQSLTIETVGVVRLVSDHATV